MHPGTVSVGIKNRGLGNSTCPCDNLSQIWARITTFAPNMHPGTLSAVIENGGHWPWRSRSFWPFWLRILGNLACPCDNSSQVWAWITKFAPNIHLGILWLIWVVLKMGVIDLDLLGHLAISTHETAFNVALVHWSRLATGCYTSQTCPCKWYHRFSFKTGNSQKWR